MNNQNSYGPLLNQDGNQSEEALPFEDGQQQPSDQQIQSHARVSMTTGGTFQRDHISYADSVQNQRLEEDKFRSSQDIVNTGNAQTLQQALNKGRVAMGNSSREMLDLPIKAQAESEDEEDPSDNNSDNSSDMEAQQALINQLKETNGAKLTKKVKERYLLNKTRAAIRERLQRQICQEFAYEKRIVDAFNLDQTVNIASDEEDQKISKQTQNQIKTIDPYKTRNNQVMPAHDKSESKEQDEIAPPVKANENKKTYLRNYAIEFELPSKVVRGAKIFRKDPRYIFQVLNYLIPRSDDTIVREKKPKAETVLSGDEEGSDVDQGTLTDVTMVHTYNHDGSKPESKTFKQQFGKYQQGACVKLLFKENINKGIQEKGKVMIGLENKNIKVNNIILKFSNNGKYLAVFLRELNTLKIYDVDNDTPERIMKKLDNEHSQEEIHWNFTGEPEDVDKEEVAAPVEQTNDQEPGTLLEFVRRIDFGNNDKYLLLFGPRQIMILDLEKKELQKVFKLDDPIHCMPTGTYERLLDARVASIESCGDDQDGITQPYRCQVACKKVGQKMVDIFDIDYFENKKKGVFEKICNTAFERTPFKNELRTITYFEDDHTNLYCKINSDFSKVILVNRQDNYILQDDKVYSNDGETIDEGARQVARSSSDPNIRKARENTKRSQHIKRLPQLVGKVTNYIYPWKNDFFLVAYHDYDQSMDIIFTDQDKFEVDFPKQIQPGIMKIYDMILKIEDDDQKCQLTVVSSRDNGFSLDQATFRLKPKSRHQSPMEIDQKTPIQYSSDSQAPLQAFFTKWPYSCYQGLDDKYIIILSAYDKDNINRVEIPNVDKICATYITETNNLYVMSQKDEKYVLQYIDLDANNRSEATNKVFDNYRVTKIFEYQSQNVDNMPFNEIHIRGSSDKEVIDNNQKLSVFFLHAGCLYKWIQSNDQKRKIKAYSELGREVQKLNQSNREQSQDSLNQSQLLNNQLEAQVQDYMNDEKLQLLSENVNSQQFYTIDDNNFLLLEDIYSEENQDVLIGQNIVQYKVDFSDVQQFILLEETIENEKIINFSVDQLRMKLIIFSRVQKLSDDQNQKLTIYDLVKKKIDYERLIKGKELCGRLESGLYTIVDGHIYYGNNCIKMRYDLIEQPNSSTHTEMEIFDTYQGLFSLKEGDMIISGCPFDCMAFHKFVYVIKRPKDPSRVVITPYLHEKKIFMHRFKENTEYFYTSIESQNAQIQTNNLFENGPDQNSRQYSEQFRSLICINLTESKYYVFSMKGLLRNRIDFSSAVKKHGLPVAVSENGLNFVLFHKNLRTHGRPECSIYHIQEHEFTFVKTIELDNCLASYRDRLIKSQEPNRKIFGKKIEQMMKINKWINPEDKKRRENFKKTKNVKFSFQINNKMDILIKFQNTKPKQSYSDKVTREPGLLLDSVVRKEDSSLPDAMFNSLKQLPFNTMGNSMLSANSSPLIKKPTNTPIKIHPEDDLGKSVRKELGVSNYEIEDADKDKYLKYNSVYYFQSGAYQVPVRRSPEVTKSIQSVVHDHSHDMHNLARIDQHFLYFVDDYKQNMALSTKLDKDDECALQTGMESLLPLFDADKARIHHMPEDVRLNTHFAIFFNRHQLWKINLIGPEFFKIEDVDFKITPAIGPKRIKDVRVGNNKNIMVIIIEQSNVEDTIIIWNVSKNIEKENFDISEDYEILWDADGNPYIQTNERTIFTRERTSMLCFDNLDITDLKARSKNFQQISLGSGLRFDSQNHHWMIMKEHVSFAFSYMTFVMQQQIEENGLNPLNKFDITPFNYLISKQTAFLDGGFVRNDVEMLEEVLQNLVEKDPLYLSQLQYTRKKKLNVKRSPRQSVLHIAVQTQNNRLIDILLHYLSYNDMNCSQFYEDIMYKLINQKQFCAFYSSTLLKSVSMREKLIFRINTPYNDNLADINYSNSLYLDEGYFKKMMSDQSGESENLKGILSCKSIPVDIQALRINWILENDDDHGLNFLFELYDTKVLETYDNQAVQILTEFLIMKYRVWLIPAFWALNFMQIMVFIISIICDENRWYNPTLDKSDNFDPLDTNHKEGWEELIECIKVSDGSKFRDYLVCLKEKGHFSEIKADVVWTIAAQVFGALNLLFTFIQAVLLWVELRKSKTSANLYQFMTKWRVMETLYIVLNAVQTIFQIISLERFLYAQRCIAALVVIILFAKGMYYLKLIDYFARHIEIFFDIMMMIPSFLIILGIFWMCFSVSFYLMGQNQVQFDEVIPDKVPKYYDFWDSLYVVWNIPLGNVDDVAVFWGDDDFAKGKWAGQSNAILIILFLLSTFIMLIHLLNMLVAIMGEIFGKQSQDMSRITVAEKLRFIVDKWYYKKFVLNSKDQIKYIIAAFIAQDEKGGDQMMLLELEQASINHERDVQKFTDHIYSTLKEAKSHHEQQEKETHSMKLNIKKIHDLVNSLEGKYGNKKQNE